MLLIATPAVVYLANYLDRLPRPLRAMTVVAGLTIGLSLFDIMGRAAYAAFMGAGRHQHLCPCSRRRTDTLRLKAVA